MYKPVKDGIEKSVDSVKYTETAPPDDLQDLVHSFWELKTEKTLPNDFCLHVLPDACVNILLNIKSPDIAAVTSLHTTFEVLNLGRTFHYAGVQLLPGVWRGNRDEIAHSLVDTPYAGNLPLTQAAQTLAKIGFSEGQNILSGLVRQLKDQKLIQANPVTAQILANLDSIYSVTDMAAAVDLSPRQLQRTLKQTMGFSPHDLLKVLRLQHSFRGQYLASYADQAHFIHSFRKITGYTPTRYEKKFDV